MGYISAEVRNRVRQQSRDRCGYCQSQQQYVPVIFEVDHIRPIAQGGPDDEDNLWLACRTCNKNKSEQIEAVDPLTKQRVTLFNPRFQRWSEHFQWTNNSTHVTGITPVGRATVLALQLNNALLVSVRRLWVSIEWHPPDEELFTDS